MIWEAVKKWTGNQTYANFNELPTFLVNFQHVMNEHTRNIIFVIWITTIWNVWFIRNSILFKHVKDGSLRYPP